jgi:hypothetical protein
MIYNWMCLEMTIDYSAIAAMAALLTSLVAVAALWYESKRWRFSMGIDLYMKLEERFNSDLMHKTRKAAARALLSDHVRPGTPDQTALEDTLDFFEMIGFLVSRGALDDKMVWHGFFNFIHPYWLSARGYIEDQRTIDPTVWVDLDQLHRRLLSVEKNERKCSDADLAWSKDSLRAFLQTEYQL